MNERGTAIVTGTSSGIGLATARVLLAQGYSVVGIDRERPLLGQSQTLTPRFEPVTGDAGDPSVLAHAMSLTSGDKLVCAVACAGDMAGGRPVWQTDADDYVSAFRENALTVVELARAAIPAMLASPDPSRCRFVAVTSAAGDRGLFHLGAYVASKHAAAGVLRALARDLVGTGISAIGVSPGSTRTPLLERTAQLYDVSVDELAQHQLIRRLLEPDEVAQTIALCCGEGGAALNGSIVQADGGFTG